MYLVKMSMLAEPRRKSKYSVDPRGLTWSNDDGKFGQKMLEKMGWSKGKGLGANEDGRSDHVDVKLKSDTRGVGCSKSHADNWIAHQDDFNSLLASLNEANDNQAGQKTQEKEDEVISLEEKSKRSKGRVHYMKFTKGKDLSSKKGEELDCIFGRRKSKADLNSCDPSLKKEVSNTDNNESDNDATNDSAENADKSHGVVTIKNTLSIADYFSQKMAEKRKLTVGNLKHSQSDQQLQGKENISSYSLDKCSNVATKELTLGRCNTEPVFSATSMAIPNTQEKKKKLKKNKKQKKDKDILLEEETSSVCIDENKIDIDVKPKKKKKRKLEIGKESCCNDNANNSVDFIPVFKKKDNERSPKRKVAFSISSEEETEVRVKSKKKRKRENDGEKHKEKKKYLKNQQQSKSNNNVEDSEMEARVDTSTIGKNTTSSKVIKQSKNDTKSGGKSSQCDITVEKTLDSNTDYIIKISMKKPHRKVRKANASKLLKKEKGVQLAKTSATSEKYFAGSNFMEIKGYQRFTN